MSARASLHVFPGPNGGWSVRHYGTQRAWRHFSQKTDAVRWGRQVVRDRGGELFIHRQDGSVQARNQYTVNHPSPAYSSHASTSG
jgi:Uncharacterized protein conserved in bacteria (DUF2188)